MASWLEFQASAPEIAERGRGLLFRTGTGEGLLSTLAGEGLPRTHPVNIGIVDGRLMTFVQSGSSKARDLAVDGRYALHAHQDPAVPHEFLLRGRGVEVTDAETRARAVESWPFEAEDEVHARRAWHRPGLFGERGDPDAWPPRYASWRATIAATR